MCLLVLSFKQDASYPFILLHNRDEYYERPTEQAHFYRDGPGLLAGRDIRFGGTWMGITRQGRFGTVTNYRDPAGRREHGLSRGLMLLDFLTGDIPAPDFLSDLQRQADSYAGFNLLIGTVDELYYFSNMGPPPIRLEPGLHGMSNHLLDTPWPKVQRSKALFIETRHRNSEARHGPFLELLADEVRTADDELPDTGVGLEIERGLSSIRVDIGEYGTRSSTVITVDAEGIVRFTEKTIDPVAGKDQLVEETFNVKSRLSA